MMRGDDDGSQPRIENRDRRGRRTVQAVQCHAVAPDRRPAFDHDQRPPRDLWQRGQRVVVPLRNISNRRGIGFFETGEFYADFSS